MGAARKNEIERAGLFSHFPGKWYMQYIAKWNLRLIQCQLYRQPWEGFDESQQSVARHRDGCVQRIASNTGIEPDRQFNCVQPQQIQNEREIRMIQDAKEAVMSYIKAMSDRDYAAARKYLGDNVRVKGPGGEAFRSPDEFLKMMEQQHGKYDIKKVFVDGSDVCLLYDFITPKVTTFFCSWYRVNEGKISSIQTVFDPRAFSAPQ
jgi:hypothetical protein